jgi:hypothetical protein
VVRSLIFILTQFCISSKKYKNKIKHNNEKYHTNYKYLILEYVLNLFLILFTCMPVFPFFFNGHMPDFPIVLLQTSRHGAVRSGCGRKIFYRNVGICFMTLFCSLIFSIYGCGGMIQAIAIQSEERIICLLRRIFHMRR